jgi:hypothetical protein
MYDIEQKGSNRAEAVILMGQNIATWSGGFLEWLGSHLLDTRTFTQIGGSGEINCHYAAVRSAWFDASRLANGDESCWHARISL